MNKRFYKKGENKMGSFQLKMPNCPKCNSDDTKIDIKDYANLVKIPATTSAAMMIGVPLLSVSFICQQCGEQFKTKDF